MIDLTALALAVVLGATGGVGMLLTATRVPRWAAPALARRIAPYVRDIGDPLGLTPLSPLDGRGGWWERVSRRLGGGDAIDRRLAQAGWRVTVPVWRLRQLTCGVAGLIGGGALAVVATLSGRSGATSAVIAPVAAISAVGLCNLALNVAARRRTRRVLEEVPILLEFIALCLSAGESLIDALRRVGDIGAGELTGHLRGAVLASGTGSNLSDALTIMARTLDVASVSRAIDQLVAAMERGAPLAQVLQAQADDAREESRRVLIEQAGRKEILMLLPLVFLVLPLSVLFAVFPGVVMLRLGL